MSPYFFIDKIKNSAYNNNDIKTKEIIFMICSICGREIQMMESHNAFPVRKYSSFGETENRCCPECNENYVIPFRIAGMRVSEEQYKAAHRKLKNCSEEMLKVILGK